MNDRLDRQSAFITNEGTNRIQNLYIHVIGGGTVGAASAQSLALIGACSGEDGSMVVADFDTLSISNTNRLTIGANKDDIGSLKGDLLKRALNLPNPTPNLKIHTQRIDEEYIDLMFSQGRLPDLVISAFDEISLFPYLHEAAMEHGVPILLPADIHSKSIIDWHDYSNSNSSLFNGRVDSNTVNKLKDSRKHGSLSIRRAAEAEFLFKQIGPFNVSAEMLKAFTNKILSEKNGEESSASFQQWAPAAFGTAAAVSSLITDWVQGYGIKNRAILDMQKSHRPLGLRLQKRVEQVEAMIGLVKAMKSVRKIKTSPTY